MESDEAIRLLKTGPDGIRQWNQWRERNEGIPDLSGADFSSADLSRVNLRGANLAGADLRGTTLIDSNLIESALNRAKLGGANLSGANFRASNLIEANLSGADLSAVNFSSAKLNGADLSQAKCWFTVLADVDLSNAIGLDTLLHVGPIELGINTLFLSRGTITKKFLGDCKFPEPVIENLLALIDSMQPIQFYSCFISHSSIDNAFARRLYSRMKDEGLRVWFDEEHMKGGQELHLQLEEAIRVYDKLLLVLSEASMNSKWVNTEIRRARLAEQTNGKRKLFPIRLIDYELIEAWELLDSSGEDLAEKVRLLYIPDFSNWKDHDSFEAAFDRLLGDLKSTTLEDEKPA